MMKRLSFLLPALLFAATVTAPAAIVYSGVQNISVPQTFAGVYLNVVTQSISFTQPADFDTAPWLNLDFGGTGISNGDALLPVIAAPDRVLNLTTAQSVGSPSNLPVGASYSDSHPGPAVDQFQIQTIGYMGFAFRAAPADPIQYGWARLTISNTGSGTVHDWAYETTPVTSIQVGTIPEPAGISFLLASMGVVALRRSRR